MQETRIRNNITVNENGLPPGSVVIGGSVLKQQNNEYLTIADTEKLTVVMADMIKLPSQLSVLGLNDSDISNLLNVSAQERNAQVIRDLRQSLTALEEICEDMSQLVDRSLIKNRDYPKKNSLFYNQKYVNEAMWYTTLSLYWSKALSCRLTLEKSMDNIRRNRKITDSDIQRARSKMVSLLEYYGKLARRSHDVISPA